MAPMVLLVHQSVPANDFPGFVTWAKQQAKGVDIAVAGPTPEVATALLAQQAKLNLVNVPSAAAAPRCSRCWPATPRSSSRRRRCR